MATCYLLAWTAVVAARFDADRVSEDDLDDGSSPAAAAAAAGCPRASFVWASSFAPRYLWLKSLTPRSGLAAAAAPDVGGWWTVVWTECFIGERFTGAVVLALVLLAVVTVMLVVVLVVVVVVGLAWWRGRWGGAVVARKARTYRTRKSTNWWIELRVVSCARDAHVYLVATVSFHRKSKPIACQKSPGSPFALAKLDAEGKLSRKNKRLFSLQKFNLKRCKRFEEDSFLIAITQCWFCR